MTIYELKIRVGFVVVALLSTGHFVGAVETQFGNVEELAAAARTAVAGDVLVLKAGEYDLDEAVTFATGDGGETNHPVTVKAESNGGCVLRGDTTVFAFKPGSSNVVVSGFVFRVRDETAVKIDGAHHIRVTRCEFQLSETDSFDWLVITGENSHHNRVDRCRFSMKRQPGNFITIDGDAAGQQSQYDRIDHNYFGDTSPRVKNEKEAVRIGWSEISLSSGFTVLEHNFFERCDGDPEIVSVKSCDNTIRYNRIVDSLGVLSLRHGNRSSVYGNVIRGNGRDGCGGIRVYGDDHRIYNNYLVNLTGERFDAALAITNGDADEAKVGGRLNAHFRPRRIEVVNNSLINNTHPIEIGYSKQGKKQWRKTPLEILFANNLVTGKHGPLVKMFAETKSCVWKNNLFWPSEAASTGLSSEAGGGIQVVNPELERSGGFWFPSSRRASVLSAVRCKYASHDLLGAKRNENPTVGALELMPDAIDETQYDLSEVGPFAAESPALPHVVIDPLKSLHRQLQSHSESPSQVPRDE